MRITFILPGDSPSPTGGYRVIYEYANRLSILGNTVNLVHAPYQLYGEDRIISIINTRLSYQKLLWKYKVSPRPKPWFQLSPQVKTLWVPTLHKCHIPEGDVIFATAWNTAEWVASYPESKGKKMYLIQGLETWAGDAQRVYATWQLPLQRIVVSTWLKSLVEAEGVSASHIPIGLDFSEFGVDVPPDERNPTQVSMPYYPSEGQAYKGTADGLAAIEEVRRTGIDIRVDLFGMSLPSTLPHWAAYFVNPSRRQLRSIYNKATIFVSPSHTEGFGLPGCEAALCSTALCMTDAGGHRDYAEHGRTALLSPPKEPKALAANLKRLVEDTSLRRACVRAAHVTVQQFTWEKSVARMLEVLQKSL